MTTIDMTDPRIAGRIIAGDPTVSLAEAVDQLTPEQMRAALHRLAALASRRHPEVPCEPGILLLAEAQVGSGGTSTAYTWNEGSYEDDEDRPGWYDVTGAEYGPRTVHEIRYPYGAERAVDDPPTCEREVDGWWEHNSAIIVAICGGTR